MENKFLVRCDECGSLFNLRSSNIKVIKNVEIKDKLFDVTYFVCEKCGRKYVIELSDNTMENLKKVYYKCLDDVVKDKLNSKDFSDEVPEELQQRKNDAVSYQKWLIDHYESLIPPEAFN